MTLSIGIAGRAGDIAGEDWDRLAGRGHPFGRHAFWTSVEDSGSATAETGWRPAHLVARDGERVAGILPGYLKSHSFGEYVFDQGWADAWERAGGRYYPKLLHATPFTPATAGKVFAESTQAAQRLVQASRALVGQNNLSGAHALFLGDEDARLLEADGWLPRHDIQFHWQNDGYRGFDEFLGTFRSRKRKTVHREREAALAAVDEVVHLSGRDLTEAVWDDFFAFYMDTGSRKWGRPYLTRDFFSLIGERMGEQVLLVMARRGGRFVAGALNFIGEEALYGRQWGCVEDIPFLHFELCYHQAIDIACTRGLARVEAGAQGPHKMARGYRPVATCSMHWIEDMGFRRAVDEYLARERAMVAADIATLEKELPFRHDV